MYVPSKNSATNARFEVRKVGDLSDGLLMRLDHWFEEEFGYLGKVWAGSEWYILAWEGSALVGQTGLLKRRVKVGDREVELSGAHGVITKPTHRGRGIGTAMMRIVEEFTASGLGLEFSMLHCFTRQVPFYSQLGWQQVDNPVTCDQPDGKERRPPVNMVLECGRTEWPDGPVYLCGYPW
jgi:GNAT superfamily N-acetyltransferase